MIIRIAILTVCLTLSAVFIARASKTEHVPPRASLSEMPYRLDKWIGREGTPFEPEILSVLGVDEYVNRVYDSGPAVAGLSIGYYQSQRQGDTIHSPLNCLPGAGWEPLSRTYLPVAVSVRRTCRVRRSPSTDTSFAKVSTGRSCCTGIRVTGAWSRTNTAARC